MFGSGQRIHDGGRVRLVGSAGGSERNSAECQVVGDESGSVSGRVVPTLFRSHLATYAESSLVVPSKPRSDGRSSGIASSMMDQITWSLMCR